MVMAKKTKQQRKDEILAEVAASVTETFKNLGIDMNVDVRFEKLGKNGPPVKVELVRVPKH